LGPLSLVIGGLTGFLEAESENRGKTEGTILGILTGGAGTGSMFSGMLGVEKGSTTDKTLGVAGATAWGAAAGAAIGSAFFGIGAVPGAIIGGIIGAAFEFMKIITEGTDLLSDLFSPISAVFGAVGSWLGGIWKVIKGIF